MYRAATLPWVRRDPFGLYFGRGGTSAQRVVLSTTTKLDVFGVERIGNYDTSPIGVTTLIKPCPPGKLG